MSVKSINIEFLEVQPTVTFPHQKNPNKTLEHSDMATSLQNSKCFDTLDFNDSLIFFLMPLHVCCPL